MSYKLLTAFLIITLAIVFQLALGDASGVWINFALAALIAASFFVSFLELLALILFSVLVLNWQPALSFELLTFSLLPIAAFFARKFIPFKPWLWNLAAIVLGLLIFYLSLGARFLVAAPSIFLWDLLGCLLLGIVAFRGLLFADTRI